MHFKNGTEAHESDPAIYKDYAGNVRAGVLHSITPASTTCNGMLTYPVPGGVNQLSVTIGDGYSAADAFAAIAALEPKVTVTTTP